MGAGEFVAQWGKWRLTGKNNFSAWSGKSQPAWGKAAAAMAAGGFLLPLTRSGSLLAAREAAAAGVPADLSSPFG